MLKTRHLNLFLVVSVARHTGGRAVRQWNNFGGQFPFLIFLLLPHEPLSLPRRDDRTLETLEMLRCAARGIAVVRSSLLRVAPTTQHKYLSSDDGPSRLEWKELGDAEAHVPGAVGDDGVTWAQNLVRGPGGIFPPDFRKGKQGRRKGQVTYLSHRASFHTLSFCMTAVCEANAGR